MPKIHANGIDIAYEISGKESALPLVLISGISYDRWQWHRMVPGLAEHFQVVVFDNRGVGQTDKPEGAYSAQMLADDTAGLIEGLGFRQAAVMGHSMGGFIVQALALSRPDLVCKLILASTNFGGPHHIPVTPEAMAILMDPSGDPLERLKRGLVVGCAPGFAERQPEFIQEWIDYRLHNPILPGPYQSQLAVGLGLLPEAASFEPRLKEIGVPALILFGAEDKVVPPGNAELLARQIPGSAVRILPGAGHHFPLEVPQAANEAIIQFLEAEKR